MKNILSIYAIVALLVLGIVFGSLLACAGEPEDVAEDSSTRYITQSRHWDCGVTYITQYWDWNESDNVSSYTWSESVGDNCTDIMLQWIKGDNQTTHTIIRYRLE